MVYQFGFLRSHDFSTNNIQSELASHELYITSHNNEELMNCRKEVKIYFSFLLKGTLFDAVMTGTV